MKLRIRIEGKTYDVEVEVLEEQESAPDYPPYPPVQPTYSPATLPEPLIKPRTDLEENSKECRSPVTGMVIKVNVVPGQLVPPDEVVIVLESMKMEMQITAPEGGIVKNVLVAPGSAVKVNQLMVEFE